MTVQNSEKLEYSAPRPGYLYVFVIHAIVSSFAGYLFFGTIKDGSIESVLLGILAPIMVLGYTWMLYVYLRSGYSFSFDDVGFNILKLSGKWIHVNFHEIRSLRCSRMNKNDLILEYETHDGANWLFINSITSNFGSLVEAILDYSINIQEMPNELKLERIAAIKWQKQPNWTIINTAKRRAEENCKKLGLKHTI